MTDLPQISQEQAVALSAAVAALGIVWEVLELNIARRTLLVQFFDWPVVRSRYYILLRHPWLAVTFDTLLSGRTFDWLVRLHGAAAGAFPFVFLWSPRAAAVLAAIVLLGHLGIHLRFLVGMDGADQMQTVVWTGLMVFALDLGPIANSAAAAFICIQLLLSYVVAGAAKIVSPVWRGGSAVGRITRATTYSSPGVTRVMAVPAASFAASWATMLFELGAPLLLLTGRPGAVAVFIAMGCAFHIGIALSMGLTTFVFAFLATYPVLYQAVGW